MLDFRDLALSADALVERARRKTGLEEFGDVPFIEGLRKFLQACNDEADLSLFGVLGTRWDVVRFLSNLLQLRQREIVEPRILDQRIEQPIFIAGVPRSGTTYLHQLLSSDSQNGVPRIWQLIHPYPGNGADRRKKTVARQLKMFEILAPEFHGLHPVTADSPQECTEITAHVFASLRFDTNYFAPSYRRWVDQTGHLDAYRFHKRFLQHLQHQVGGSARWVLKCPDHVFALDAIRAVYPDARFVFVHRDPARVLLSVTRLTEVLRRPFTRHVDRAQLGRDVADRWLAGTEVMIDAADQEPFAEPIFHIDYQTLVRNPIGSVARLYRHFGLDLDSATADRIRASSEARPDGGGYAGARRYSFETYHLDPAVEQERYEPYIKRFDIPVEQNPPHRPSARQPTLGSKAVSGVSD